MVAYPSKPIMDGTSSVSWAVSPSGGLVYMPPEMIHPDFDGVAPKHNCSTWFSSAPALTDAPGFLQWYYQSMCQQLAFYHRQVSPHFNIHLDLAALRHVFYIDNGAAGRQAPRVWEHRPEPQLFEKRKATVNEWRDTNDSRSRFISYMQRNVPYGKQPPRAATMH